MDPHTLAAELKSRGIRVSSVLESPCPSAGDHLIRLDDEWEVQVSSYDNWTCLVRHTRGGLWHYHARRRVSGLIVDISCYSPYRPTIPEAEAVHGRV